MEDKDIVREQNYINRIEVFKERTDEFFANYENLSGGEECLEVCLIRDGCRAVSQAEETINHLQAESEQKDKNYIELLKTSSERAVIIGEQGAENERLKNILICFMEALGKVRKVDDIDEISLIPLMSELNKQYRAELKAEAYKECIEKVKENIPSSLVYISSDMIENIIDNLLKKLVGDK